MKFRTAWPLKWHFGGHKKSYFGGYFVRNFVWHFIRNLIPLKCHFQASVENPLVSYSSDACTDHMNIVPVTWEWLHLDIIIYNFKLIKMFKFKEYYLKMLHFLVSVFYITSITRDEITFPYKCCSIKLNISCPWLSSWIWWGKDLHDIQKVYIIMKAQSQWA